MPSFTVILSCLFLAYVGHSVYTFSRIFMTPECTKDPCFGSFLANEPLLQLAFFVSHKTTPLSSEVHLLDLIGDFDYGSELEKYTRDSSALILTI